MHPFRVEVFFIFHPHAHRLLHTQSFMASLSLSPSHPKFPAIPVLHSICAISSLYTAAVSSPPLPDFSKVAPGMCCNSVTPLFCALILFRQDEIFTQKYRVKEGRPDSFAEHQAKLAKETADILEVLGESFVQVLQGKYWQMQKHPTLSHCTSSHHPFMVLLVPL